MVFLEKTLQKPFAVLIGKSIIEELDFSSQITCVSTIVKFSYNWKNIPVYNRLSKQCWVKVYETTFYFYETAYIQKKENSIIKTKYSN